MRESANSNGQLLVSTSASFPPLESLNTGINSGCAYNNYLGFVKVQLCACRKDDKIISNASIVVRNADS